MRSDSLTSSSSRRSPEKLTIAMAAISAMMNATIANSISVKPRWRGRAVRMVLLVEVPVANVGILAFAAFLAVGSEGIQVVLLAVGSREHVLIRVAPGILADAPQVAAFAPVAHRGIVRALNERVQSEVRARVLVVVQLVHRQRGLET